MKNNFYYSLVMLGKYSIYAYAIGVILLSTAFAKDGAAQNIRSVKEVRITLNMSKSSLLDVFKTIEAETDYSFVYDPDNSDITSKDGINLRVRNATLENVLLDLSRQAKIGFRQVNNRISVKASPGTQKEIEIVIDQQTINGTIIDETGEGLPGATVLEKGTSNGTITDVEGKFTLSVNENAILNVSFVGYKPVEVAVNGQTSLSISLEADVASLEEVVVVGYGTVKKSDLTGAVSSINEDDLTAYPSVNALQAIQGRAAGVVIQSTNGEPGGQFKIRVRGATSINASSNPLFVIDGLVGGTLPPADDIASIEILKDASATAIYGSRGANGVVMVTTKSGKSGKTQIKLNSFYSFQREIGRMDVLNAQEFAEYINDARGTNFFDVNNITDDTDWQDLIYQPGYTQNYQLSVSGGSDKSQYYVSGIFFDQQGVVKKSAYDRYSLTTNFKFNPLDRLKIGLNTFLQGSVNDGVISQGGAGPTNLGAINSAQRFDPNQPVQEPDGTYTTSAVGIAAFDNPVAIIDGREQQEKADNIQVNAKAELTLAEGLTFNSTFGAIVRNRRDGEYNSKINTTGISNNGLASLGYARNYNFLTEQYVDYKLSLGEKNSINVVGGYSYQIFKNESFSASNANFISDALGYWNLGVGTTLQIPSSGYSESKIASFYGRANYNFDDRYLVTFTSRYDGASQFSEGNQWSFFPSGALSWNMHNENFWLNNQVVTGLKLRTSYGLTGNQAIGPYQSLARISKSFFVINSTSVNTVRPTSIANSDLTWETTSQFNIGADVAFLEDRISLTAEYYRKETNDLLFSVPIPIFSGYQTRLENLGSIENKGLELQLDAQVLVSKFKWSSNFNVTLNKNKVLELPDNVDILYSSAPSNNGGTMETSLLRVGEPVGVFYGYVYEGVYQSGDTFIPGGGFETSEGGERFADIDDNQILDSEDRTIIGDPNPKAVWGFNNDFSYKGLYLNMFFQAFTGGDMLNLVRLDMDRLSGNTNATKEALRRWTPENTETDVPMAAAGRVSRVSSRFVEDGSFLRLKNISLGYDFDASILKKIGMGSARVYVSGQNLLTFTNYSGVDPEVGYRSSNVNLGLDYDSYPSTKAYTVGINLTF